MQTLRDRIIYLLEVRGLTQKQATERGGFKNTAFINDIVRGHKLSVTGKNLTALALAFDTTEGFLLGRTGEDARLKEQMTRSGEPLSIPEYDVRAGTAYGGGTDGAGEWASGDIAGHKAVAYWGLPQPYVEQELGLSFGYVDILPIQGDSMDDGTRNALISGDRVMVDKRSSDVRQGGIFAVWDGDGVIIKQVELIRGTEPPQIICKSRNAAYDPIHLVLDGNVHIIGRIAGKISRM